MRIDAFHYELPPEQIAQHPTDDREAARLLHVPNGDCPLEHRTIADLAELVPKGALVVVNDTKVLPARLLGNKSDTGGKVEILLVRPVGRRTLKTQDDDVRDVEIWRALGKSSKPLRLGSDVDAGPLRVHVLRRDDDGLLEVALSTQRGTDVRDALRAVGHVPLPPYIKRGDVAADTLRYQTVFARVEGAIAAPTAGLHLSRALLDRLAVRECEIASITLHVGLGTFQPVTVDDLDHHPMHAESFEVPRTVEVAIDRAREHGAPVVAVGTTVVRALESAARDGGTNGLSGPGRVDAASGETRLLIQPGYRFRVVDRLLTNFHLPRSTLLALVCAFGGTERVLDAYATAVSKGYRFFSYGDAMLLSCRADSRA